MLGFGFGLLGLGDVLGGGENKFRFEHSRKFRNEPGNKISETKKHTQTRTQNEAGIRAIVLARVRGVRIMKGVIPSSSEGEGEGEN